MLLLLKQTAESPDRRQHLNLGGQPGDLLHLGGFKDIISGHDVNRESAFGLCYKGLLAKKNLRSLEFEYDVSVLPSARGVPVVKSVTYTAGGRTFKAERQQKGAYRLTTVNSVLSGTSAEAGPLSAKKIL